MKDSTKAYAIMLWGFVPILLLLSCLILFGLGTLDIGTNHSILVLFIVLFGIAFALQFHPRAKHFTAARDKWEKSYRYEEEAEA